MRGRNKAEELLDLAESCCRMPADDFQAHFTGAPDDVLDKVQLALKFRLHSAAYKFKALVEDFDEQQIAQEVL